MAKDTDLVGLGTAPALAKLSGFTIGGVTATGTSAGTAASVGDLTFINITTASSQTGVILNANTPLAQPIVLFSPQSDSAVVYPPTGATINAASSITVAQNKVLLVMRYSATVFASILTG